ncbi:MAG: methylmalonyl-CoA carboxyltransferase [Clostridiales bacterium]|nr:methylmalonyl-CoA carboxyltransferase [Clostridiales bacterium]
MGKLNDLQQKRLTIEQGGGAEKIKWQHENGKKTARERIAMLFDEGSFVEVDAFVTHRCGEFNMADNYAPAEGVVTGYGTVDGRLVYAYSQDYTVIGGSIGEMHAAKICKVMDMALKMGAPVIGVCDSGGARIQEGVDALKGFGDIFYHNAIASGVVPQISVVLGPCAGGAVFSPAMTDFIVMADKTSHMFITGPSVVKAVTGEDVSFDDLGGAETHATKSGVAGIRCATEEECFSQVKNLLSYLPSNNLETAPAYECTDDLNRVSEALDSIIPENGSYDVKGIIAEVADNGEYMEIFPQYAENLVTCFIRLNGSTVGVLANQPSVKSGSLDCASSEKGARFVRFCDSFNIPIVTFTDVPGYLPGTEQEYGGIIRHGAKLLYAFSEATVPKVNVILKKAYGGAYVAMNSKHLGADMVFAWPTAEIAVMGPEGAANIIFKNDIAASDNPIQTRQEKIKEYTDKFTNPYMAAARGYVDDVIEPDSTRPRLIAALEMLMSKRDSKPAKKHGNIPM